MSEKSQVINWFMELSRGVFLHPEQVSKREVKEIDIEYWSMFEQRMREIAEKVGTYYKTVDITQKIGDDWYFSAVNYYIWVMANMSIIQRSSSLRPVFETFRTCNEYGEKIRRIEHTTKTTHGQIQERVDKLYKANYRQLEMIWNDVESGKSGPPLLIGGPK